MLLIILTFTAYGMQILNPVFLQELLGYTAWKAGLAMAPRGMGVMAAMFLLGGLARKGYDTRALVYLGYTGMAISVWPHIVPPTITIWDAASSPASHGFLLVGTLFIIPFILMYTAWAYWVFRGKVSSAEGYH